MESDSTNSTVPRRGIARAVENSYWRTPDGSGPSGNLPEGMPSGRVTPPLALIGSPTFSGASGRRDEDPGLTGVCLGATGATEQDRRVGIPGVLPTAPAARE